MRRMPPSAPSTSESTKGLKSTLRKIRDWQQHASPEQITEDSPCIAHRYGHFNRPGDLGTGEFADSLVRLMHVRGHLQQIEFGSVDSSAQESEFSGFVPVRVVGQGEARGHEELRKERLDLLPGSEPLAVTLYRFVIGLAKRNRPISKPHRHDQSSSDH